MWREPVDSLRRHSGQRRENNGWSGIGYAIVFSILSFAGFEGAATLGEELRNPLRNIPVAILGTCALAGAFYVVVAYTEVVGFGLVAECCGASPEGSCADSAPMALLRW